MNNISFEARAVTPITIKYRQSKKVTLSRTEKIKQTIKKGMTIDKLPATGFVVGMLTPLPFTSVIFPAVGFLIKYSYKGFKWAQKNSDRIFDRTV